MKILILADKVGAPLNELRGVLTSRSFEVETWAIAETPLNSIENLGASEEVDCVLVVLQSEDVEILALAAYLLGRSVRLCLVKSQCVTIPTALKKAPLFDLEIENLAADVADAISTELGVDSPVTEPAIDSERFLTWLREDPMRLSSLSADHFEHLMYLILIKYGGFFHDVTCDKDPSGQILRYPESDAKFFIQCKKLLSGESVGIGHVRLAAATAATHSCALAMLCSGNDFSEAAQGFARTCLPPVWLINRFSLERVLKERWKTTKAERKSQKLVNLLLSSSLEKERHTSLTSDSKRDASLFFWDLRPEYASRSVTQIESAPFEITNRRTFVPPKVFISCYRENPNDLVRSGIAAVIMGLSQEGVDVWHDSPSLQVGHHCRFLKDVSNLARQSLLVIHFCEHGAEFSSKAARVLQTLAWEIEQAPEKAEKVYFVGEDTFWNRLRIPKVLAGSPFLPVDSEHFDASTWTQDILALINKQCHKQTR